MSIVIRMTVAATLGTATIASADIVVADYQNPAQYHYNIVHIPDLDQKRNNAPGIVGLPNDGARHCGPASMTNVMCYIANHGFPEVEPGPDNWQSQDTYNDAGAAILFMGALMGTEPTSGTNGTGMRNGTRAWLANSGVDDVFTVTSQWASGTWAPQAHTMAAAACDGALIVYAYGRYDIVDTVMNEPVVDRRGGHLVTLAEALRNGTGVFELECRNPSDPTGDEFSQSQFTRTLHPCESIFIHPDSDPTVRRSHTSIVGDYSDGRLRLIDSYYAVKPQEGFSFSNTGLHTAPVGSTSYETHNTSQTDAFPVDASFDPDLAGYYVLFDDLDTGSDLFHFDRMANTWTEIWQDSGLIAVETGRCRNVLLLRNNLIRSIDPSADPIVATTWNLSSTATAMAMDDLGDRVVVLSVPDRRLLSLPHKLTGFGSQVTIPATVPLSGNGCIAIHPATRERFICSDASDCIYVLSTDSPPGVSTICLPEVQDPQGLTFDDSGSLFVMGSDYFIQLSEVGGRMVVVPNPHSVLPVGTAFGISKSRTNFDPDEHAGPGWEHLDPDELHEFGFVIDCPWDVNRDGTVNVLDVLNVLEKWGTADVRSDVYPPQSGDDIVNVLDLLEVLAHWGDCG